MLRIFSFIFSFMLLAFLVDAQSTFNEHSLGDSINSNYPEINPIISPDGNTMYYSVYNHPHNHLKHVDGCDIWYAQRSNNGHWQRGHRLPDNVNLGTFNTVHAVLNDGNTLLIDGVYTKKGIWYDRGFSYVHKLEENVWSAPEALNIKGYTNLNQGETTTAFMNASKTWMMFSFSKHISKHNNDLYFSISKDGTNWSKPKPLPKLINSDAEEIAPFLSSDGNKLYFASDRDTQNGLFKVYTSHRLDTSSYTSWSTPEVFFDNEGVNSWEAFFRTNQLGDFAFYTHTTDSIHSSDIYEVELSTQHEIHNKRSTTLCQHNCSPVTIKVLHPDSNQFYTQDYSIYIDQQIIDETYINNIDKGISSIELTKDKTYHIDIETSDYLSFPQKTNLEADSITFQLVELKVGKHIILDQLEFDIARLLPESHWQLDKLADIMNEHGTLWIEIEGFTDETGDEKLNKVLSKDMAKSVKDYLISRGINTHRLHLKAFGSKAPITNNNTLEGHKKNRRIEILIISI